MCNIIHCMRLQATLLPHWAEELLNKSAKKGIWPNLRYSVQQISVSEFSYKKN
jgi:hypothetical protein